MNRGPSRKQQIAIRILTDSCPKIWYFALALALICHAKKVILKDEQKPALLDEIWGSQEQLQDHNLDILDLRMGNFGADQNHTS